MKLKGKFVDGKVIVEKPKEVGRLFNKSHFGKNVKGNFLELDLIESCFLLDEDKIDIKNNSERIDFENLVIIASKKILDFDVKYLAFKDLRKRGCVVNLYEGFGDITFSHFKNEYVVCVFSEESFFDFKKTRDLVNNSSKENVSLWFAVVDSEGDVTYYDVTKVDLKGHNKKKTYSKENGFLIGDSIILFNEELKDSLFKNEFFGKPFGDALRISFIEALYLLDAKILDVIKIDKTKVSREMLVKKIKEKELDSDNSYKIYCDLKKRGLVAKTGFKFGTDLRVYTRNPDEIHAEYLIHIIDKDKKIAWSEMSRAIRLAHSVNKEIIFACADNKNIEYIGFGRLRP